MVLFGIHEELISVRYALNLNGLRYTSEEPIEREVVTEREAREDIARPREVVVHEDRRVATHNGILGLSR